jgi:hypothetical protein
MEWLFGGIAISVLLGPYDDADLGLVVKSKDIALGLDPGGVLGGGGTIGGFGISVQESTSSEHVEYWPPISMGDPERRRLIYATAKAALEYAEELKEKEVGFYTMGLEVARVASWEVAEEIIRAIHVHSKVSTVIDRVIIVASSPTQLSSLQYALDNISIIL